MLPELESRVARGELSLRGVNPAVLEVDEKLLLNVNTRMDLLAARSPTGRASARTCARARRRVAGAHRHAADVVGPRRVLFVDEPARLVDDETGSMSSARRFSRSSSRPRSASGSSAASSTSTARTSTSRWSTPPSGATCSRRRRACSVADTACSTTSSASRTRCEARAAAGPLLRRRCVPRARERLLVPRALDARKLRRGEVFTRSSASTAT